MRVTDFLKIPAFGKPFGRLEVAGANFVLPTVPTAAYPFEASHAKLLDDVNQLSTAMRWCLLWFETVVSVRSLMIGQHVADT